jgi:hypothetical protein
MSSSGNDVEADSPSALFGDAASDDAPSLDTKMDDDASFATSSTEPTFMDDDFSSSSSSSQGETAFEDVDFEDEFSNDAGFQDGELFNDTSTTTEGFGSGGAEEGSSSLFGTLWDLFTGSDDE